MVKGHNHLAPGKQVKIVRQAAGITSQQLADRANKKHRNHVIQFETGKTNPTWRTIQQYAHALGYEAVLELIPLTDANAQGLSTKRSPPNSPLVQQHRRRLYGAHTHLEDHTRLLADTVVQQAALRTACLPFRHLMLPGEAAPIVDTSPYPGGEGL